MSDLFAFDEQAANPVLDEARANSVDNFDGLDAPAFRGTGFGLGMGVMRGGARTADFMQTIGSFWDEPGTDKEALDSFADEVRKNSIDYWTPTAQEVGKVGQVLGGLGEIVLPLAASGGNPALLMGATAIESGKDLVSAGVDAPTAAAVGTTQALATGLGFKIPVLGSTLTSRLATGAAGNALFGLGARSAENVLLTERGYADQAPPILDMASITTDVLTGLLFGGLHHTLAPRINPKLAPSEVDAVLAARNAKSFQTETAPGTPDGMVAEVGHQSALEAALEQLSRSEPVDVSAVVATHEASFANADHVADSAQLARDVEAGQPTDVPYPAEPSLTQQFEHQLASDPAAAEARYNALPDSEGGKVLNTDLARELSPDYQADRSLSARVHEPASAFIKRLYAQRLAEAPKAGEDPLVVFSAGGTGAGKSSGIDTSGAQIVYDTNMNRMESATQKIDQALEAGKRVEIIYTYRDPIEALTGGALPRAMRQEARSGSGRTVPLNEHVGTHVGARETMERLAAHYAGDDRVKIRVFDNTHGKGNARHATLAQIPKFDAAAYNRLREEASTALDAEHQAGRISDAVYRGFREDSQRSGGGPAGGADARQAQSASTEPLVSTLSLGEALKAKPSEASEVPELATLQQLAHERPSAPVYAGFDADGQPIRTTLADAADQIQRDYENDLNTAKAYEVAVQCFLGRGA